MHHLKVEQIVKKITCIRFTKNYAWNYFPCLTDMPEVIYFLKIKAAQSDETKCK